MKRTFSIAALALCLAPFAASAQNDSGGHRFQACVWPNRCGPGPQAPSAPKPEAGSSQQGQAKEPAKAPAEPGKEAPKAIPNLSMPTDPLSQAILQRQLAGEDGIVSAVRLSKEQTGWKEDQIVYHGKPDLRDSLAPLALPASAIPKAKKDAKEKDDGKDEWAKIDSSGAAAGQANSMREERVSLTGSQAESKEGMDRMWGDKAKPGRADK